MNRYALGLLVCGMTAAITLGQATKPSDPAPLPPAAPGTSADPSGKADRPKDDSKPDGPKLVLKGRRPHNTPVPGSERGKWTSYDAMHNFFVERFVESEGFGISRMISQRDLARSNAIYISGQDYRIGTVRLLSLGEPDKDGNPGKPFAYEPTEKSAILGFDPARKSLKQTEKKALGTFEAEALAKLKSGEQTVMGADGGKQMLIGAVRATTQCLECHSVKEGTLLGAFRYSLEKVEAPRANDGKVIQ